MVRLYNSLNLHHITHPSWGIAVDRRQHHWRKFFRLRYTLLLLALLVLTAMPRTTHAVALTISCTAGVGDSAALAAAVTASNTDNQPNTIDLINGCVYTLSASLYINSDGGNSLTIQGNGATLSGNDTVSVFSVNSGAVLNLDKLTITQGKAPYAGGGIYNAGTVTLTNSIFKANSAGNYGGGIYNAGTATIINSLFIQNSGIGGGIHSNGTLTVSNSVLSGNSGAAIHIPPGSTASIMNSTLSDNSSGGIVNYGTLTVTNTTLSANTGYGAILNGNSGTLTLTHSTLVGNSGLHGAGISNMGSAYVKNTLIARSLTSGNCENSPYVPNATFTSAGSLADDASCPGFTSVSTADLRLGSLTDNGGPTPTIPLLPGSAAIDAITPVNGQCDVPTDQRGIPRPQGTGCDVGAFEFQVSVQPRLAVSKVADSAGVKPGQTIGFTIQVINTGQVAATNVSVSDTLPINAGLAWTIAAAEPDSGCAISNGVLNCTISTLAAGSSQSIHITSATTQDTCGIVNNTASAAIDAGSSASASASTQVNCAYLIVKKHVINDNGGLLQAKDFSLIVNTSSGTPITITGDENGTKLVIDAGYYSVFEPPVAGYQLIGPPCFGSINVGETKYCTVTNDDQPPRGTLIIRKVVVNDDGGTSQAWNFNFSLQLNDRYYYVSFYPDGVSQLVVDAGTYTITEPPAPGYFTSYDNCADITVPANGSVTCTITNNDIRPQLTVVKVVKNDNGGQAAANDFALTVGNSAVSTSVINGQATGFRAGIYTVSESGPSGYSATYSGDCDSNGNVTLQIGDSKTCTITNDDQPATLIVKKHVVNVDGGTSGAGDFNLTVTGNNVSMAAFAGSEDGTTVTLDAGSYSVSETAASGYEASYSAGCSGRIAVGETKTCTVTNDDIPPYRATSCITSNFNGIAISTGKFIWFNSVLNIKGQGSSPVNVYLENSTIQFSANGTTYNLSVPNATITFDPAATTATTSFVDNRWVTTVPANLNGNAFLSGLAFPVPSGGLPGVINPVKWCGDLKTNAPGITVKWKWAAAVYTNFSTDNNMLGVKPVDRSTASVFKNSDHAGTPENFKSFVVGGARGGGDSNYTGGYSGITSIVLTSAPSSQAPVAPTFEPPTPQP